MPVVIGYSLNRMRARRDEPDRARAIQAAL